jgi:hypothetical protein
LLAASLAAWRRRSEHEFVESGTGSPLLASAMTRNMNSPGMVTVSRVSLSMPTLRAINCTYNVNFAHLTYIINILLIVERHGTNGQPHFHVILNAARSEYCIRTWIPSTGH